MALFAISDFHLALKGDKPMDVFGDHWIGHDEKIKENWIKNINEEDTVLIAGDISWSMSLDDGMNDLQWIHELPGKKVISKGNHDYWWGSINKLNSYYEDIFFIQNNHSNYEDYAICGTRGWICPGNKNFDAHDEKIYKRELIRLRLSLDSAVNAGYSKFIVMLHYPPTNDKFKSSGFTDICKEYRVSKVIYGHLHGPFNYGVLNGELEGVQYSLTSCDFLNFDSIKII